MPFLKLGFHPLVIEVLIGSDDILNLSEQPTILGEGGGPRGSRRLLYLSRPLKRKALPAQHHSDLLHTPLMSVRVDSSSIALTCAWLTLPLI